MVSNKNNRFQKVKKAFKFKVQYKNIIHHSLCRDDDFLLLQQRKIPITQQHIFPNNILIFFTYCMLIYLINQSINLFKESYLRVRNFSIKFQHSSLQLKIISSFARKVQNQYGPNLSTLCWLNCGIAKTFRKLLHTECKLVYLGATDRTVNNVLAKLAMLW